MTNQEQGGFAFEGPLEHIPASQMPVMAPRGDPGVLTAQLRGLLDQMPDDIELDDLLTAAGFAVWSLEGWHRARAIEALTDPPVFQGYKYDKAGKMRWKRLPPLSACPGYGDETCSTPTRGGVLCGRHAQHETEELWNQL